MPKVSVIIPAYNSMAYLPKTVESVLNQTFADFELLIVDDGSSDRTVEWVSQLTDSRIKLITQKNQGASVARNTGIAQAQGELIAFLDNDDLWKPTKLEQQIRCLEQHPHAGLVHTWMVLIDEHGTSTGRVITSNAEGFVWQQLVEQDTVLNSSVLVRRECFDAVGVFDPTIPRTGDWEMWLRVAACYPFALIREPLVLYRQHTHNASRNLQVMEDEFRVCIEKIFAGAPMELLYLRNRSYGYAYVYLAWKALQNSDGKQAVLYNQQAIAHYAQLNRDRQYWRQRVAIAAMRWLGSEGYRKLMDGIYALRRRITDATV